MPGRPGSGGRQPHATPYSGTSATAELYARLGPPQRHSLGGVQMLVWIDDEHGDGVIFARLSGRELKNGETAMGQVHPAHSLCASEGLRPRLIVVTLNNTGARDYGERPDFGLVAEAREAGWLRWTMWRDVDRMAREPLAAELFWRLQREAEIDLYLTRLGRAVDWNRDRSLLRTLGVFSAEERELIKQRTHEALVSRYLKEGRGWPAARPFGFRRNPLTKFLEVDPEQWEFVKRLHYGYATFEDENGHGIRRIAADLADLGCELGRSQIQRILANRIYVDGKSSVTYDGVVYPVRPVALSDPIPEEIFWRNQELLALRRGKNTRTPPGVFVLNVVPIVHARCARERRRDRAAHLRGRIQKGRETRRYKHWPWVPRTCRGYGLSQASLEPPVLRALRTLDQHPLVRERWASTRGLRPKLVLDPLLCPEQLRQLSRRRAALRRQLARLERSSLDRLAAGEAIDGESFGQLTAAVRGEVSELDDRIKRSEAAISHLDPRGSQEVRDQSGLQQALERVLSLDVPKDRERRLARMAAVAAAITRIVIKDSDDGQLRIEIHSPLAPPA